MKRKTIILKPILAKKALKRIGVDNLKFIEKLADEIDHIKPVKKQNRKTNSGWNALMAAQGWR